MNDTEFNIELKNFESIPHSFEKIVQAQFLYSYYSNHKENLTPLINKLNNLEYLIHLLNYYTDFLENQKKFINNRYFFPKKTIKKRNEIKSYSNEFKSLEQDLLYIKQSDYLLSTIVYNLEIQFSKEPEFFNLFLKKIPMYFNNNSENITLLLSHILKEELSYEIYLTIFGYIKNNPKLIQKYGQKLFHIVEAINYNEQDVSEFENYLELLGAN